MRCIGCNACVAACYAENNVPVMGAEALQRSRTMSWLRIERFVEPDPRMPTRGSSRCCASTAITRRARRFARLCATYHTDEGLERADLQPLRRHAVLLNNCPYKVRRFNWFEPEFPEPLHLQLNPDVTVRSVGVMEKCTFCVQRHSGGQGPARRTRTGR